MNASSAPLLLLRERFLWMGRHSGYDGLFDAIAERSSDPVENLFRTRSELQNFVWAPLALASWPKTPFYNGDSAAAEWALERSMRRAGEGVAHIAYVENGLRRLAKRRRRHGVKLVATAHQPADWWRSRHGRPEMLSSLDALIVLCRSQAEFFESFLPGRVHTIPHGVDTDFFCPAASASHAAAPRCVFAGTWMRDRATLRVVVDALLARCPEAYVDMLVPEDKRKDPDLEALARHDRVVWHADVSDEALREIYRGARLLLLPLVDCTANNGLLEAMSCGLPIVTTDVGGIRDYTDERFADRLPLGDTDGLLAATLRLVGDADEARTRGQRARQHCIDHLGWGALAERTLEVYRYLK